MPARNLEAVIAATREVGDMAMARWRGEGKAVNVWHKSENNPVSDVDLAVDARLKAVLGAMVPEAGWLSEETADNSDRLSRRFMWCVDPIDGTQSFVHGVPLYGNLVSLEDEHGPAIGVVNIPGLDECVWAGRGRGCFVDDRPTGVSDHAGIAGACVVTSGVDYWLSADRLQPFIQQGTVIRTWGDAYGYVLVATGRADAMVDPIVSRWDVAPFLTILPEAGGVFSDFTGTVTADGGNAMAANPTLHAELVDLLAT